MSPRHPILAALLAIALLAVASPAMAKPAPIPGWNPADPPANQSLFEAGFPGILYAVSCGDLSATGWSADVADDTLHDLKAVIVTTSSVSEACARTPEALVVRQGDDTFAARPWIFGTPSGVGSVVLEEDLPYIDWDFVPMPRLGQWVAIDARGADGEPRPMLVRRIVSTGDDTFAVDAPVGPEYLGAPVVDNMARALGTVMAAGTEITGSPQFCDTLFACTDPTRVWWDITAPSAPRDVKAVGGKGKVTVTWKPAASDGGDEVAYWSRIGLGRWTYAEKFSVIVKARKGARVTVSVQSVNEAGPGPGRTVSATAK